VPIDTGVSADEFQRIDDRTEWKMATQEQAPRANKPGAMTKAMQAVQTVQGPRSSVSA